MRDGWLKQYTLNQQYLLRYLSGVLQICHQKCTPQKKQNGTRCEHKNADTSKTKKDTLKRKKLFYFIFK